MADLVKHWFGDEAAAVAETATGDRIPNAQGRVYRNKGDLVPETNLTNEDGTSTSIITTDDHGMIKPFRGPDGVTTLWAEFIDGYRYQIFMTDGPQALSEHINGEDPHGDRQYTDVRLVDYVHKRDSNSVQTSQAPYLAVETHSGDGAVIRLAREGAEGTALSSDGTLAVVPYADTAAVSVDAKSLADATPAVAILGPEAAPTVLLYGNGNGRFKGMLQVDGRIDSSNVGNSRVFSGPVAPDNPKPGDVWVEYAE